MMKRTIAILGLSLSLTGCGFGDGNHGDGLEPNSWAAARHGLEALGGWETDNELRTAWSGRSRAAGGADAATRRRVRGGALETISTIRQNDEGPKKNPPRATSARPWDGQRFASGGR